MRVAAFKKARWPLSDRSPRHGLSVLHAPSSCGGNSYELCRALREIGLEAQSVSGDGGRFSQPTDHYLWEPSTPEWLRHLRRLKAICRANIGYSHIHYNFGTTFTSRLLRFELVIGRILHRELYVTFQGDDARQGEYQLKHFEISIARNGAPENYDKSSDSRKRKRIQTFSRYTSGMFVVNPDLLWILPRTAQFVPYSNVDLNLRTINNRKRDDTDRRVRILHAPSHRGTKGTNFILNVLADLQIQYGSERIEIVILEDVPRDEVWDAICTVDLVVDQLYAGWYGGLAVEAMAVGVPVMSYLRNSDFGFVPEEMILDLPVINVCSESLREALQRFLEMTASEREVLSYKSRRYVEKWHDSRLIARYFKHIYSSKFEEFEAPLSFGAFVEQERRGRES